MAGTQQSWCQTGASAPGWDPSKKIDARPGGICLTEEGFGWASEDAQRARARGMWVGMWHAVWAWHVAAAAEVNGGLGLGMVPLVIHTYRSYASSKQQAAAAAAVAAAARWAGLGWLDFEGWPSIRFVMAERTVYAGAGAGRGG